MSFFFSIIGPRIVAYTSIVSNYIKLLVNSDGLLVPGIPVEKNDNMAHFQPQCGETLSNIPPLSDQRPIRKCSAPGAMHPPCRTRARRLCTKSLAPSGTWESMHQKLAKGGSAA